LTQAGNNIADTIRDELTSIDNWGWLSCRQLALLMPCTSSDKASERANQILDRLASTAIEAQSSIATYPCPEEDRPQSGGVGRWAAIHYRRQPHWKRTIDVLGASLGIVLVSPLLIATAAMIKLVSRGPIFFRQQRIGALGEPFSMWKFRTMCVSVDASIHQAHVTQQMQANGTMSKLDTEQPLIPFGRSLRQLGIDELPQLFNVLQGNMSLIGPRPDVAPFESYKPWQRRRFDVLPGITGLWQVSGKNETTFEEMMRLDARYVDHRSMWLDMKIVLMTIPTVLGQWWLEDDTP
jgi:lipopolysaccharide/colanic/teichoic acid biosynthesis glycosyltransferase